MEDGYIGVAVHEYISKEELGLLHAFQNAQERLKLNLDVADANLGRAHAEKRAAEAELIASEADYKGQIMQLLWKYKLTSRDGLDQKSGAIIRRKDEERHDAGREGSEDS